MAGLLSLGLVSAAPACMSAPVDAAPPRSLTRLALRIRPQLRDVRAIRQGLEQKRSCFGASLSKYQDIKGANITAVGEEALRINKLGEASVRLQAEVAAFSADLQSRQARLATESAKMDEIRAEGRRLASELDKCRAVFFLTPDICNWGENIARDKGSIRNIPDESDRQQRSIDSARRAVEEDQGRLSASQSALTSATSEMASAKQRKDQADAAIAGSARTIELLEVTLKSYRSGINDIDLKVKRIDLLLAHPDEDDLDTVKAYIGQIRADQPSTAGRSEEPLPADVRAPCAW